MKFNQAMRRWIRISLLNFLVLAILGCLLRYKIVFYFPFVDQSNLLHAHSHFAFTGWVNQALMILMVSHLSRQSGDAIFRRYKWVFIANLVSAYAMLFSFGIQGYGMISIVFSTFSIFVSYAFCYMFWRDMNKWSLPKTAKPWFKAAIVFNVLSSAGAFTLAYLMANKIVNQHLYLASVYFFLHFQYNGWFIFACLGLLISYIGPSLSGKRMYVAYLLMAAACIPAYLLSVLWIDLPIWLYVITVVAAAAQCVSWTLICRNIYELIKHKTLPFIKPVLFVFVLSAVAFSAKLLLQFGSVVPSLSKLAFGFRPIVIGYLHLVLLGVVSLFVAGSLISELKVVLGRVAKAGLALMVIGILLNEMLLMLQGVAAINATIVHGIERYLLGAAAVIMSGILLLNFNRFERTTCLQS